MSFHDTHKSNLYCGILYFSIAVSYQNLFLENIHVLLHCELANCWKQFINKSTQCVYEATFIALPCHNFMST